jgi:hypothetical protein
MRWTDAKQDFFFRRNLSRGFPKLPPEGLTEKDFITGMSPYDDPLAPRTVLRVEKSDFFEKKYFWRLEIGGEKYLLVNIGNRLRKAESMNVDEALSAAGKPRSYELYRSGALKETNDFLEDRRRVIRNKIYAVYREEYPNLSPTILKRMLAYDSMNDNADVLVLIKTDESDPRKVAVGDFARNAVMTIALARSSKVLTHGNAPGSGHHSILHPHDSKFDDGPWEMIPDEGREGLDRAEIARLVSFRRLEMGHSRPLRGAVYKKVLELALDPEAPVRELVVLQTDKTAKVLGDKLFFERDPARNEYGEFLMRMEAGFGKERFDKFWSLSEEWSRDVKIDPPSKAAGSVSRPD